MGVERIDSFSFPGHDNDKALACDAPQFGDCCTVIENMFDDMGADDRIECLIGKRQLFNRSLNEFETLQGGLTRNDDVNANIPFDLVTKPSADQAQEVACATTNIANGGVSH